MRLIRSGALVFGANIADTAAVLLRNVLLARLLSAGADDAWLSPIVMKKGRPAHTVHALGRGPAVDVIRDRMFELLPTLGVRETASTKWVLDRRWTSVTGASCPC